MDAKRLTEQALSEAPAGRIKPVIGQTFPLDQAADAHAAIQARDVIGTAADLTALAQHPPPADWLRTLRLQAGDEVETRGVKRKGWR